MAQNIDINSNTTFLDKLFNQGIKSFGYEKVITIINSIYNRYQIPIISIGSGIGAIEYLANKKYYEKYKENMNWICIDIDNNPINYPSEAKYYINNPLMKIDYNSCDKLIEDNPSIIGNCILFLNWCLPNDSTYDYEAIVKLKPKAVLSIYEIFDDNYGCAGGEMFYNWTINSNYNLREMYKLYYDISRIDDYEDNDIRIGWWENNHNYDDAIIIRLPCMHYERRMGNCSIS